MAFPKTVQRVDQLFNEDATIDGEKKFLKPIDGTLKNMPDFNAGVDAEGNDISKTYIKNTGGTFTGPVFLPDVSKDDNSLQAATTKFVRDLFTELIGEAPESLDNIEKLAAAIGGDAEFSKNIKKLIEAKATDVDVVHLAGAEVITGAKKFTAPIEANITGTAAKATYANTAAPDDNSTRIANTEWVCEKLKTYTPSDIDSSKVVILEGNQVINGVKAFTEVVKGTIENAQKAKTAADGDKSQSIANTEFVAKAIETALALFKPTDPSVCMESVVFVESATIPGVSVNLGLTDCDPTKDIIMIWDEGLMLVPNVDYVVNEDLTVDFLNSIKSQHNLYILVYKVGSNDAMEYCISKHVAIKENEIINNPIVNYREGSDTLMISTGGMLLIPEMQYEMRDHNKIKFTIPVATNDALTYIVFKNNQVQQYRMMSSGIISGDILDLPMTNFNPEKDVLLVNYEGMVCIPGEQYEIVDGKIKFLLDIDVNHMIGFVLFKN